MGILTTELTLTGTHTALWGKLLYTALCTEGRNPSACYTSPTGPVNMPHDSFSSCAKEVALCLSMKLGRSLLGTGEVVTDAGSAPGTLWWFVAMGRGTAEQCQSLCPGQADRVQAQPSRASHSCSGRREGSVF